MNGEQAAGAGATHRLGQVQSLVRAFGVLDALAELDEGLTLTELAGRVGLPRSTAHRLLTTMEALAYVAFDAGTQRWSVGVQAFRVGRAFAHARDYGRLGRPIMRTLALGAGETVSIAVPGGGGVRYQAQMRSASAVAGLAVQGAELGWWSCAAGKAIAAHLPPAEQDAWLAGSLKPRTRRTLTDPVALRAELELVRARGWALDDEEHAPGLRCVAGAVLNEEGRPSAALSVSGAARRLGDDRLPALAAQLQRAARRLAHNAGGRRAA